jgi:hypothetical protein
LKALYPRLYSAVKKRLCVENISVPGKEYFQKLDISCLKKKSIFKSINFLLFYSPKTIWKEIV